MRGAILRWTTGRMQRKSKERQSTDSLQGSFCLGLRRHPAAKRFPPGNDWMFGKQSKRCSHGAANRCLRQLRRIWPLGAALHVRKLETQAGEAVTREFCGDGGHKGMIHPRAGAMR